MAQQINIGDTVFSGEEIAVVTRIERRGDEVQVYGLFCTGPLNNSENAVGELNEFLLTGITRA